MVVDDRIFLGELKTRTQACLIMGPLGIDEITTYPTPIRSTLIPVTKKVSLQKAPRKKKDRKGKIIHDMTYDYNLRSFEPRRNNWGIPCRRCLVGRANS